MLVQVIGKPLRYARRNFQVGEPVTMTRKHARLFITLGRVSLPSPSDIPAAPSVPVVVTEGAGYERTDMQAEEISERTGKPKRRYTRRDMQAKDK